jgi:hypothetical protein
MLRWSTANRRAVSVTAATAKGTTQIDRTSGAFAETVTYLLPIFAATILDGSNYLGKLVTRVGIEPTAL